MEMSGGKYTASCDGRKRFFLGIVKAIFALIDQFIDIYAS